MAKRPDYTKILEFPVLFAGWEMDSKGWIAELNTDKSKVLVLTNHGVEYLADRSELQARIREYQRVINKSEEALDLL